MTHNKTLSSDLKQVLRKEAQTARYLQGLVDSSKNNKPCSVQSRLFPTYRQGYLFSIK